MIVALVAEGALLAVAALLAAVLAIDPDEAGAWTVIAVLAVSMGLRNAVVRRLGVADLTTTVLTLTLTGLAADSAAGGGRGRGSLRRPAAVAAMGAGAVAGALLVRDGVAPTLVVAGALALAAAAALQVAGRHP